LNTITISRSHVIALGLLRARIPGAGAMRLSTINYHRSGPAADDRCSKRCRKRKRFQLPRTGRSARLHLHHLQRRERLPTGGLTVLKRVQDSCDRRNRACATSCASSASRFDPMRRTPRGDGILRSLGCARLVSSDWTFLLDLSDGSASAFHVFSRFGVLTLRIRSATSQSRCRTILRGAADRQRPAACEHLHSVSSCSPTPVLSDVQTRLLFRNRRKTIAQ